MDDYREEMDQRQSRWRPGLVTMVLVLGAVLGIALIVLLKLISLL